MTACARCIAFSDLLCVFGPVCTLYSGNESRFVVFLVAFCKRQGLYQSAVTQSVSCLGAGLVLTMLMTGLLLNCEALWFYLWRVEWTLFFLFSSFKYVCPGAPRDCSSLMSHNFATKAWGQFEVVENVWWQRGNTERTMEKVILGIWDDIMSWWYL